MIKKTGKIGLFMCLMGILGGCVSPDVSKINQIAVDSDPLQGGISSADIRTVASQMAPAILTLPEIANAKNISIIKVADFKNSSRFFVDRNLFMKRLMIELNRYGRGKIRFLSNNSQVQVSRADILKERQEKQIIAGLKEIALNIANSAIVQPNKAVKIAVIPVFNVNLINMNADSFAAMLRSEISNATRGKVQFLLPGEMNGADYYLTGQFIPESMKTEGIINVANYIDVIDARIKAGKSMHIIAETADRASNAQVTSVTAGNVTTSTISPADRKIALYENHLVKLLNDPAMRANPNVSKRLSIMIADAKTKAIVHENMIMLDRKISDNSGMADYIISGEISGMHQRKNGVASDYIVVSIQLTDPETNMVVWEDAYEVKRISSSGIVYR